MWVQRLLDAACRGCGAASYRQLSKRLGVSRQIIHHWRENEAIPTESQVIRLCELAGENRDAWLLQRAAERLRRYNSHEAAALIESLIESVNKSDTSERV